MGRWPAAVVVPSLGAPSLTACLAALRALGPSPQKVVLVLSGGATPPAGAGGVETVVVPQRLGFAAAVNRGIVAAGDVDSVALVNDDVVVPPGWLGVLGDALGRDDRLAGVQGTLLCGDGATVDGRGIELDRWALPVQVDRDQRGTEEDAGTRRLLAVSGTACLLRREALAAVALIGGAVLDERFGSYHEDLDLGLRLRRLGWRAAWVGGASAIHAGSATGRTMRWRRAWWLLANRWRAFSGNLSPRALAAAGPRLCRGEARAVRTLLRSDPRALVVAAAVAAALPGLIAGGLRRRTPGPRLEAMP